MKTFFLISLALGLSAQAATEQLLTPLRPSDEIEASCRVKAKEIAAETYRGCVTDQKNAQIEQIKKDYAAKLLALKAQYEAELKKMGNLKSKAAVEDLETPESKKKSQRTSAKKVSLSKRKVSKKTAQVAPDEMTVQLKPAPVAPAADESTMDLPEPIPLEEIPTGDTAI